VIPVLNDISDFPLPLFPDFVVYKIAPLPALLPKSAAAGPPFKTLIDSISSGLISADASP